MAQCSLLIVRPDDKKRVGGQHENVTQIGEQAGLRFIKLRHFKGPRNGPQAIRGFQSTHITLVADRRTGRPSFEVNHSQIAEKPVDGQMPLLFGEDPIDGQLYAYVPDTEFNRNALVATYFPGAEWDIVDKRIAHDIKEQFDALDVQIKVERTKDEALADQKTELDKALAEAAKLKEENERLRRISAAASLKATRKPGKDETDANTQPTGDADKG